MLSFVYTGDYDDDQLPDWALNRCAANANASGVFADKRNQIADEIHEDERKNNTETDVHGQKDPNKAISRAGETSLTKHERSSLLRMEVNTLVHACADKFGIDSLKHAAEEKFRASIVDNCKSTHFEDAVQLLFQVAGPENHKLKYLLFHWCIHNPGFVPTGVLETMAKQEPLSCKLYLEMKRMLESTQKKLEMAENEDRKLHLMVKSLLESEPPASRCRFCFGPWSTGGVFHKNDESSGRPFDIYYGCTGCGRRQ
jgi:hypothetical protein